MSLRPTPRRFLPALREIEALLRLPVPRRTRLLRELESDLEGLQESWIARGLSPDEARARAEATLLPDPETAREMSRIHAPLYARLTRGLPEDRLRVAERAALVVTAVVVVAGGAGSLLRAGVLDAPSPHLWLVLAAGVLMLAHAGLQAFDLWIRGRHESVTGRLPGLLLLAGVTLAAGAGGVLLDLYRVTGELALGPGSSPDLVLPWLGRACVTLSVAFLLALVGGLAWFCMAQWLAWTEHAHRQLLLSPPPKP